MIIIYRIFNLNYHIQHDIVLLPVIFHNLNSTFTAVGYYPVVALKIIYIKIKLLETEKHEKSDQERWRCENNSVTSISGGIYIQILSQLDG